ncbi:hypothetical protein BTVI_99221 [Pitangus sulphuratus]|nr:hypothetical protein BTVI_99221 [Pitangus sulphuratus]
MPADHDEEPLMAYTERKKAHATHWSTSKGKEFPEEAVQQLPLHQALVSTIHNSVMQSAVGVNSIIPIQERCGDTATGQVQFSNDSFPFTKMAHVDWQVRRRDGQPKFDISND